MPRVALVTGLVILRIVLVLLAFHAIPQSGSGALTSDARRFLQISRAPGLPYRDVAVEFPPVSVAVTDLLARGAGDARAVAWRLVWTMFACELAVAAILAWAWGGDVAIAFLLVGTPVAWFIYFRADLLSVAFAAAGLGLSRRGCSRAGALSVVAGAFTKVWPALLLPLFAVRRQWRGLWLGFVGGVVGLVAWVSVLGPDGPWQVLTFRGATGWGVESTIGLPLWLLAHDPVRFEAGAYRVGHAPLLIRGVLVAAILAIAVFVWTRATERTAYGAAPAAVLAGLLLFSPHVSLQWVVWLFPCVAISRDMRLSIWSSLAGACASGIYLAATAGGRVAGVAAGLEFVRVIAIAAVLAEAMRVVIADGNSATTIRGRRHER